MMKIPFGRRTGAVVLLCWLTACTGGAETELSIPEATEATSAMEEDAQDPTDPEDPADPAEADDPVADQDPATVQGTVLDARTVVFDEGTNVGGVTVHTPDVDVVAAVLATADAHEELIWARDHARFVYGVEEPAGTPAVNVFFACEQPAITDTARGLELLRTASNVDGGGECYGQAVFKLDGSLIWVIRN